MPRETMIVDRFTMGGTEYVINVQYGGTGDTWKLTATKDGKPVPVHRNGIKVIRALRSEHIAREAKIIATHLVSTHMYDAFEPLVEG